MRCKTCRAFDDAEHAPWCPGSDPGERSPFAIIWERLEDLDEKIDRLAQQVGLPDDWDDE